MSECECENDKIWLEALGYVGGSILAIAPWQQLYKTVKRRSARDISLKSYYLLVIGLSLSIFFTAYKRILPILIPESIEMLGWLLLISCKKIWFKDQNKNYKKKTKNRKKNHEVRETSLREIPPVDDQPPPTILNLSDPSNNQGESNTDNLSEYDSDGDRSPSPGAIIDRAFDFSEMGDTHL